MRILIIGGTAFVGRHIAQAAIDAGHDVTLFHRGKTGAGLFPQATHLTGDRDEDLSPLARRSWDATIDFCACFPRQVRSLAAALGSRGGRYVYISSVSAYSPDVPWNYSEGASLLEPADPEATEITNENYGGLEADARDQASFIVSLLERSVSGTFHTVNPAPPFGFGQMLAEIAAELRGRPCSPATAAHGGRHPGRGTGDHTPGSRATGRPGNAVARALETNRPVAPTQALTAQALTASISS